MRLAVTQPGLVWAIGLVVLVAFVFRDRCFQSCEMTTATSCEPLVTNGEQCPTCPPLSSNTATAPLFSLDRRGDSSLFSPIKPQKVAEEMAKFSKFTPTEWETLAVELTRRHARNKYTLITFASMGDRPLVLNWIASLKRNDYIQFVIFCLDLELVEVLVKLGLSRHVVLVPEHWRIVSNMDKTRLNVQLHLLHSGLSLVYSSIDTVLLSPFVVAHVDYLIGSGCSPAQPSQCFTDFVFMYRDNTVDVDLGFYVSRPTELVKALFRTVIQSTRDLGTEQEFNRVVQYQLKIQDDKALKGLDRQLYASRINYFTLQLNQEMNMIPLVVRGLQSDLQAGGFWV
ncbi:hypothetical protein BASA81_005853 [Batrachochytrium salamandrivorans]|nr:hypothetical protein BASA81_005853 [Batrachochytrium salamandrivorans]